MTGAIACTLHSDTAMTSCDSAPTSNLRGTLPTSSADVVHMTSLAFVPIHQSYRVQNLTVGKCTSITDIHTISQYKAAR